MGGWGLVSVLFLLHDSVTVEQFLCVTCPCRDCVQFWFVCGMSSYLNKLVAYLAIFAGFISSLTIFVTLLRSVILSS